MKIINQTFNVFYLIKNKINFTINKINYKSQKKNMKSKKM